MNWRTLFCLPIFLAGVVASGNLSRLVGTNPHYEAHWGKIVFAVLLAIMFSYMATARRAE